MNKLWPIVMSAKKGITAPRMRHIDFTPAPNAAGKLKQIIAILALSGTVLLILQVILNTPK